MNQLNNKRSRINRRQHHCHPNQLENNPSSSIKNMHSGTLQHTSIDMNTTGTSFRSHHCPTRRRRQDRQDRKALKVLTKPLCPRPSPLVTTILFNILFIIIQPSSNILLVNGLICTQLLPKTLSSLHQLLSSPSRTAFLCPFTLEGPEACDTDAPFILDKTFNGWSKSLKCDFSGQCKINCNVKSHFIVKDGKELILDSVTLQGAKEGSVHVVGSNFRSIQSIFRE